MEASVKALSKYRFEKAQKNIKVAESLFADDFYAAALNRAYYALFDALRAVNALDKFDSSKHSGVISHFNQYHVKMGEFDTSVSSTIRMAARLRERSDYEDFYEPDQEEAKETIEATKELVESVREFLVKKGVVER